MIDTFKNKRPFSFLTYTCILLVICILFDIQTMYKYLARLKLFLGYVNNTVQDCFYFFLRSKFEGLKGYIF